MIMNWELVKKVVVGMVIKQNFMEKLLDGVEVEWKSLGEVAELKRGKTIRYTAPIRDLFPRLLQKVGYLRHF